MFKRLATLALVLGAAALVGCTTPAPAARSDADVQEQILKDPMGYKPTLEKNVDDTDGLNKDLHDVFGP